MDSSNAGTAAAVRGAALGGGGDGSGTPQRSTRHDAPRSTRHDRFPRWFRMSAKLALVVLLLALPVLALRAPQLTGNRPADPKFDILFMLLGTLVVPMWMPFVGALTLTLTVALPIVFAAVWLSYGLFLALPNPYFMWAWIVAVTLVLLFAAPLYGLPVPLFSIFVALFAMLSGNYLMKPRIALLFAEVFSGAVLVGGAIALLLYSTLFPEYCTDAVWAGHHEGLEHLHHMAHYVTGSKPPRLLQRAATSEAHRLGASGSQRAALHAVSTKLPGGERAAASLHKEDSVGALRQVSVDEGDADAGAGPRHGERLRLSPAQKVERSYYRMNTAMHAGAGAGAGSKGELVLGFCGTTRPVIPWSPLIPTKRCRPDMALLADVRADATAVGMALYKLHGALQLLDAEMRPVLARVEASSGASWASLKGHLLGSLEELVSAFPQDYYPPPRPLDPSHVDAFRREAAEVWAAWQDLARDEGGDSELASPAARLHATLLLVQLEGIGTELARLHASCAAAMSGLQASLYGFMGFPCCVPSA